MQGAHGAWLPRMTKDGRGGHGHWHGHGVAEEGPKSNATPGILRHRRREARAARPHILICPWVVATQEVPERVAHELSCRVCTFACGGAACDSVDYVCELWGRHVPLGAVAAAGESRARVAHTRSSPPLSLTMVLVVREVTTDVSCCTTLHRPIVHASRTLRYMIALLARGSRHAR